MDMEQIFAQLDAQQQAAQNGAPPAADDQAAGEYPTWSPEELVAIRKVSDFSPYTRLAALAQSAGRAALPFNLPLSEWEVSQFVAFSVIVGALGLSNLTKGTLGPFDPAAYASLRHCSVDILKASFKVPKVAAARAYDQLSLAAEVANLYGASYENVDGKSQIVCPAHSITIDVDFVNCLSYCVTKGGPEACKILSAARGVEIIYRDIPIAVHRISSLIFSRRTIALDQEGNLTFKPLARNWKTELMGPEVHVEQIMGVTIGTWCDDLSRLYATNKPAAGVSIRDREFISELGHIHWMRLPEQKRITISNFLEGFSRVVDKNCKLSRFYALGPDAATPADWIHVFTDGTPALKHPCGAKVESHNTLLNYSAVSDYAEKLRQIRATKDYLRKSDCPSVTGVADAVTSVPAKYAYAHRVMYDEGVKLKYDVDAFGIGESNHWEELLVSLTSAVGTNLSFKDLVPQFHPKGNSSYSQADITQLTPGSGSGKMLFDDTYVVIESAKDSNDRRISVKARSPTGVPASHLKLSAILRANYEAGIVKVYFGSEMPTAVSVGLVPQILLDFKAKYGYAAFFPGSSAHSQEYLFAFGNLETGTNMLQRPSALSGVLGKNAISPEEWKAYARSWMVGKGADLIRAGFYNTIKTMVGIMPDRFSPLVKSYSSTRETDLNVPLSGMDKLNGSQLGRVANLGVSNNNNEEKVGVFAF